MNSATRSGRMGPHVTSHVERRADRRGDRGAASSGAVPDRAGGVRRAARGPAGGRAADEERDAAEPGRGDRNAVTGAIGLHGGAEFMAGDEPFLLALLQAAAPAADGSPVRVVVVPTAAARQGPDAAARHGREAFERVAADAGIAVTVEVARIVDAESANDAALAGLLAAAHLIYLPGGDSDLLPRVLRDSLAWGSILAAHARGAVGAGAGAGATARPTPDRAPLGWLDGLGLVHGLVVVPHYEKFDPRGWEATLDELRAAGLGYLGIDERTGVVSSPNGSAATTWRVVGPGRVQWFPLDGERVSGTSGETIPLPR